MTLRHIPGCVWVRLHVSRHIEPQWRVSGREYYDGIIRRLAWAVRGWGVVVMWMPKNWRFE